MNKIKTAIIHWLGGVTIEEATNNIAACQIESIKTAFRAFREKIREYNGLPADEWCKRVWDLAEKLADAEVTVEHADDDENT
jgi:hypothetical protein